MESLARNKYLLYYILNRLTDDAIDSLVQTSSLFRQVVDDDYWKIRTEYRFGSEILKRYPIQPEQTYRNYYRQLIYRMNHPITVYWITDGFISLHKPVEPSIPIQTNFNDVLQADNPVILLVSNQTTSRYIFPSSEDAILWLMYDTNIQDVLSQNYVDIYEFGEILKNTHHYQLEYMEDSDSKTIEYTIIPIVFQ